MYTIHATSLSPSAIFFSLPSSFMELNPNSSTNPPHHPLIYKSFHHIILHYTSHQFYYPYSPHHKCFQPKSSPLGNRPYMKLTSSKDYSPHPLSRDIGL